MTTLSPDLLSSVLDGFPLGVALLSPQGKVFYANRALGRISGLETFELLDDGFYNLAFPSRESNARLREKVLGAAEVPFDDLELIAELGHDRDQRHFRFSGAGIPGREPCLILVVQDVTHSKAFEKVMESSFDNFIQVTNALDRAMKKIGEQNAILEQYKEKMTRELAIARGVQKTIIPREFPRLPGFDLYGVAIPTDELGGDYFDWFAIGEDRVGLLITDVSGHGVPSSLITTMVKASFDFQTRRHTDPALVLTEVNRDLTALIADTGFFLTAFYGVLHLSTREFVVAVAGHEPTLCLCGGHLTRLGGEGEGTILGTFPDAVFSSRSYTLEPGSKVLAFTDGILEARSSTGEFYGLDRLEAVFRAQAGRSARQTVEALVASTDRFFQGAAPNDDRTLWVFDLGASVSLVSDLVRGKQAFVEKDFQASYDALARVLETERTAEVCSLAGQALAFLERLSEAAALLEEATGLDGRNTKAWYYLGIVRHNQGDLTGAREAWSRVKDQDPQYKNIQALLSQAEL